MEFIEAIVLAVKKYIQNFDLDPKLVWEDFEDWLSNIPPRIQNWFATLPDRAQEWPGKFSDWAQALPGRIQYFFENFSLIINRKIANIQKYFLTCNEVEYTFWALDGVGLVMVALAFILW